MPVPGTGITKLGPQSGDPTEVLGKSVRRHGTVLPALEIVVPVDADGRRTEPRLAHRPKLLLRSWVRGVERADTTREGRNELGGEGRRFVVAVPAQFGKKPPVPLGEEGDALAVQTVGLHLVHEGAVEALESEQRVGQQPGHGLGGGKDVRVAQYDKRPLASGS